MADPICYLISEDHNLTSILIILFVFCRHSSRYGWWDQPESKYWKRRWHAYHSWVKKVSTGKPIFGFFLIFRIRAAAGSPMRTWIFVALPRWFCCLFVVKIGIYWLNVVVKLSVFKICHLLRSLWDWKFFQSCFFIFQRQLRLSSFLS